MTIFRTKRKARGGRKDRDGRPRGRGEKGDTPVKARSLQSIRINNSNSYNYTYIQLKSLSRIKQNNQIVWEQGNTEWNEKILYDKRVIDKYGVNYGLIK